MLGINPLESYVYPKLPAPIRNGIGQAKSVTNTEIGKKSLAYATTIAAQQLSGKKDGFVMNGIQAVAPNVYNAIRLAKGNLLHVPLALVFKDHYLAYRMSKESGSGVNLLETAGILTNPKLTSLVQLGLLLNEGKLKLTPEALNPLK